MTTLVPTTLFSTTIAPTTEVPTTEVPTTPRPTTTGPTTSATTVAPTTPIPVSRDTTLDRFKIMGPLDMTMTVQGVLIGLSSTDCTVLLTLTITGSFVEGAFIDGGTPPTMTLTIQGIPNFTIRKCNWVQWSEIGYLSFTQNERNVVGERPMDWKGCVYDILKLGKGVVIYGENGVTILSPADKAMAMQTIHRIGIQCKSAVCGTEFEHYFIDQKDRMYKLSQEKGLELLDYSEYLGQLTNPRMSFDTTEGFIYICDGTYGYIYSTKSGSFGEGPVNVTGIGSQSGILYVGSPTTIGVPTLEVCTDIYDFGTRKPKTIQWIEIGTDLTEHLEVQVESRTRNKNGWQKSNWVLLNPSGIAVIPAYGEEFRFRIRSYIYEEINIDYVKITGVVHGAGYRDVY